MRTVQKKLCLMILPLFIAFLMLYVLPFFYTVWFSMVENAFQLTFVGIKNYQEVFSNRYFQLAFRNTFMINALLVGVTAVCAVAVGFFLYHGQPSLYVLALLIVPFLIPSVSAAGIWREAFHTNAYASAVSCYAALLTLYVWKYTGVAGCLLYTGLLDVDTAICDAAALDGAGAVHTYLSIMLPCIRERVFLTLMVLLMFAFRIYKESYLLFGLYPSKEMYLIPHYMSNHFSKMNYQYMAVASVMLACVALGLYVIGHLSGRQGKDTI